jgi:hypothetical protein
MRPPYKPGHYEDPPRIGKRVYCRDCQHRKRGNTWELDFCRKLKKLCKHARMPKNIANIKCDPFEPKKLEVFEEN